MKKPIDLELDSMIKTAAKQSGLPEKQIEQLTSHMITYMNTGAKYGTATPEGFFRWMSEQEGNK